MAIKTYWQERASKAGLTQKALGELVGVHEVSVSYQLRGKGRRVPRYIRSAILAWEIMTEEQRERWAEAASRIDSAQREEAERLREDEAL